MRSLRISAIVIAFMLLFVVELSQAQSGVDLLSGFRPFGSYQSGDIDSIDLSNGKPIIEIPLISYPQRGGKLQQTFALRYHNTGQILGGMPGCIPSALGGDCIVFPYDSGFETPIQKGLVTANYGCAHNIGSYTCSATVVDANGSHPMAAVNSTTFRAADGTGYLLELPSSYPTLLTAPTINWTHTITDANGIRYSTNSDLSVTTIEDPNGNKIVNGTDTLGRTITAPLGFPVPLNAWPPVGSGGPYGTSDFHDCTGPLPIIGAISWTPPGLNGGTYPLKFCFVSITETMPPAPFSTTPLTTTVVQLQSIILPGGSSWIFQYASDGSGNLSQITYPWGGSVSYSWINPLYQGYPVYAAFPLAVSTRTLDPHDGTPAAVWHYNYTRFINNDYPVVTQVTDPNGADTVHTFGAAGIGPVNYLETQTQYYKTSVAANILLKTVKIDYLTQVANSKQNVQIGQTIVPIRTTTIWPNGQQSKVETGYDGGFATGDATFDANANWTGACSTCGSSLYGQAIVTREYGLVSGAFGSPLRTTTSPRLAIDDLNYLHANLLTLPTNTTVTDANNRTVSSVAFSYDEPTATLGSSGVTVQLDLTPPHSQNAPATTRGNLTSLSRYLDTNNSSVVSHFNWYDSGQLYQEIDALGNTTTHSYDNFYAGAYLTKTCDILTHCISATYDFNTGVITSSTGVNASSQASGNTAGDAAYTTHYSYDSLLRMTLAQSPPDPDNGGANPYTQFNYPPAGTFPYTVQKVSAVLPGSTQTETTTYDGLARPTKQMSPNGATVDTKYDGFNRAISVSNPYFVTTDVTYGLTTTTYDALGRPTDIVRQDGSKFHTDYGDPTVVTTTDEVGNVRRRITDVFGQTIEVDEPTSGGVQVNYHATMQQDGNFVLSNAAGAAVWSTGTSGSNASSIFMQDDGNLVLYIFKWSAGTYAAGSPGPFPAQSCSIGTYLIVGQSIHANQCIVSPHGQYMLYMAPDGNFYIYDIAHSTGTWGPGTYGHPGAYAIMQGDGNLCVYDANNVYLWCSGTSGTYAERLDMEDDGRIIIYRSAWSSLTSNGQYNGTVLAHPGCDVGIGTGWTGVLGVGSCFVSPNGHFELLMQPDGNLVIYNLTASPAVAIWSTGTALSPVDPSIARRTLYSYDLSGNLFCVEQHGDAASGTACPGTPPGPADPPTAPVAGNLWRRRLFAHDSLSRLRWASNPESGVTTYTYDANGNLLQKTSPAPNQYSTTTQTISYCYDALNRMTGKAYSAQSCTNGVLPSGTAVASYFYDQTSFNGLTITNGLGKRTGMTDQGGSEAWSYDFMGRTITDRRTTNAVSKSTGYAYDLLGNPTTITYPSGTSVVYSYNSAGQPQTVSDITNSINYVTQASYSAAGSLSVLTEGGNLTSERYYNKRLQPCRISVTTAISPTNCADSANIGNIMDFTYGFTFGSGNNGNVASIANNRNTARSQTFAYDSLNRISTAQTSATSGALCFGESFVYDAWGNLLTIGGLNAYAGCTQEHLSNGVTAYNQINTNAYDSAGNMTTGGYVYDAENHLTSAGTVNYVYDGDGRRVQKSSGTIYWYGMSSDVLDETDLTGSASTSGFNEYIFFNDKHVARRNSSSTVFYYFDDHLGTSRTIVQGGQSTPCYDADFYPFGGERQIVNTCPQNYKFTGKERDTESTLDNFGARFYASNLGRFIRPDPSGMASASLSNPQSWNFYSYALNNPLALVDPTGLEPCPSDGGVVASGAVGSFSVSEFNTPTESANNTVSDNPCPPKPSPPEIDKCSRKGGDCYKGEIADTVQGAAPLLTMVAGMSPGCMAALRTARADLSGVQRALRTWPDLQRAASANGGDPNFLAAIAIRETDFLNINERKAGGMGRGIFQIDIGKNPGVTEAQARDPKFAANFAAHMLSENHRTLARQHPNLNAAQLAQATAASYNFGTPNIHGNPATIDTATAGNNYGGNVLSLIDSCLP